MPPFENTVAVAVPAAADELNAFFQASYIVPDARPWIEMFEKIMGTQRFMEIEVTGIVDARYRGEPHNPTWRAFLGYAGSLQIEIIEPKADGDQSSYTEFLASRPQGGLHHLGTIVKDVDDAAERFTSKGSTLLQSGQLGETKYAYVETPEGAIFELAQPDANMLAAMEMIRTQEF